MDCLLDVATLVFDHFDSTSWASVNFTDPDLTKCGYNKIYQVMVNKGWVPKMLPKEGKSNAISSEFRNKGNQAYIKWKNTKYALELYTKAVCAALPDSKEIAMAYANRSAVTYDLEEFAHSIRDIDLALSNHSYPDHLKHKLYIRRGKCFTGLGLYSKALEDFELAKNHLRNSVQLQGKLAEIGNLMTSCQDQQDVPEQPSTHPIKLSHEPSPYIQCASVAVDIKHSSKMGRYVVAAMDIKPGDVLYIEKPYSSATMPEFFMELCHNCMKKCLSAVPCTSCRTIVFCSDECRQSCWTAYHSVECDILITMYSMLRNSLKKQDGAVKAIVALKILLRASKCGTDWQSIREKDPKRCTDPSKLGFVNGKYLSNHYSSIRHLATNLSKTPSDKVTILSVMALAIVYALKRTTKFFDGLDASVLASKQSRQSAKNITSNDLTLNQLIVADMLLKYTMMASINGCAIPDVSLKPATIGGGIYSFFGLFNHSCDPNVTRLPYVGDTMFSIALRPIRKGEQVFDDYGFNYILEPRDYRQEMLQDHYQFTCKCPPCKENWPLGFYVPDKPRFRQHEGKDTILELAHRMKTIVDKVLCRTATEEDFALLVEFMTLASQKVKLPWKLWVECQEGVKFYMLNKAHPGLGNRPQSISGNDLPNLNYAGIENFMRNIIGLLGLGFFPF